MKIFLAATSLLFTTAAFAQVELSTGFVSNNKGGKGVPIHLAYEFPLKGRLYTKSQVGYKAMFTRNTELDAHIKFYSIEVHQTFSFEAVKSRSYMLKPNVGLNYRFYHWKGKINPPYNTAVGRKWEVEVRNGKYVLQNFVGRNVTQYQVSNWGYSFQLQNQFRISDKVWIHVTPFIEPDYDRVQVTKGCYAGVVFNNLD
jgi:hypothetical protein